MATNRILTGKTVMDPMNIKLLKRQLIVQNFEGLMTVYLVLYKGCSNYQLNQIRLEKIWKNRVLRVLCWKFCYFVQEFRTWKDYFQLQTFQHKIFSILNFSTALSNYKWPQERHLVRICLNLPLIISNNLVHFH